MKKNEEKPLTKKDLAEFADEVLLPGVEKIVDERIEAKVPGIVNKAKLELMDFFVEKIADLRGDIILLLRKEDQRFFRLVEILYEKKILDKNDVRKMEELQLFPKITK